MNRLRSYISFSGSFSRIELLIATLALISLGVCFATLRLHFPDTLSDSVYRMMIYALYPIWGAALGKRSRDLGTTFTYGMIIGMIFPVIGLIFLFQAGKKSRITEPDDATN